MPPGCTCSHSHAQRSLVRLIERTPSARIATFQSLPPSREKSLNGSTQLRCVLPWRQSMTSSVQQAVLRVPAWAQSPDALYAFVYGVLSVNDPVSIDVPYSALLMSRQELDDSESKFHPSAPEEAGQRVAAVTGVSLNESVYRVHALDDDGVWDLRYWRAKMRECDESCTGRDCW